LHRKWPRHKAVLVPTELLNPHTQVVRLVDSLHTLEDQLADSLHILGDQLVDSRHM
jgi:hypothetical protein